MVTNGDALSKKKKEACLVLIKPDGILKSLTGNIIDELSKCGLKIIGAKVISVNKELAEKHYSDLKAKRPEIFENVLKYIMGEYHTNRVFALVYYGEDAISKIRAVVGSTHPEDADPTTIRGRYGRIHSITGLLENCVHASDSPENGEKEVKLWFKPEELTEDLFETKVETKEVETKVWA
jgi:nucleoside-diphosphate kinase